MPPTVCSVLISSTLPEGSFFFFTTGSRRPARRSRIFLRSSALPGSGRSVAISAARQAASGRRAGQMCSVEMCPWRTFFSCTESIDACLRGKATSMRRLPFMPLPHPKQRRERNRDDSWVGYANVVFERYLQSEGSVVDGLFEESTQAARVVVRVDPPTVLDLDGNAPRPDR